MEDSMFDTMDDRYQFYISDLLRNHPLNETMMEDAQNPVEVMRNNLFLQDYLRFRSLATIETYHDFLRAVLMKKLNIDIGDFEDVLWQRIPDFEPAPHPQNS